MDQSKINEKYKKHVMDYMEKSGEMSKFRAQIKAKVLKAMEIQPVQMKNELGFDHQTAFHKVNKSKEMILIVHLIKEFMNFYELEYTLPIFECETNIREKIQIDNLVKEIGLTNFDNKQPILVNLFNSFYFYKDNYNVVSTQNPQFNKTVSDKFSSLKNSNSNSKPNEEIVEMINEIKTKVKEEDTQSQTNQSQDFPVSSSLPLTKIKGKLPPISFTNNEQNDSLGGSNSEKKLNILKKFDEKEKSPTNKNFNPNIGLNPKSSPTNNSNNHIVHNPLTISHPQETNENDYPKSSSFSKFTNPNNKSIENTSELKDDICEEIDMESVEDIQDDNKLDKKTSSNSGVFASSQTFGYDNSVTSYNLDFYDYIEDVEKINKFH